MNENNHGAKYAFYYILSLISLIFIGISVGLVLFAVIDKYIIDLLSNYQRNIDSSLRFAISALFIATPMYYLSIKSIERGFRKNEISLSSQIRKWLTYFIILVSTLIILGLLISLLNNFLSGGLSTKFLLQILATLLISGLVFSYYFLDIRNEDRKKFKRMSSIYLIISVIIIIASLVLAIIMMESPKEARNKKIDGVLLNRISVIESAINSYYEQNQILPESLEDIKRSSSNMRYRFDNSSYYHPESGEEIVYNVLSDIDFELCASFKSASESWTERDAMYYHNLPTSYEAGYNCIEKTLWSVDTKTQLLQ